MTESSSYSHNNPHAVCSNCGYQSDNISDKFCIKCGSPLSEMPQEQSEEDTLINVVSETIDNEDQPLKPTLAQGMIYCPKCNAQTPEKYAFCITCGFHLDDYHDSDKKPSKDISSDADKSLEGKNRNKGDASGFIPLTRLTSPIPSSAKITNPSDVESNFVPIDSNVLTTHNDHTFHTVEEQSSEMIDSKENTVTSYNQLDEKTENIDQTKNMSQSVHGTQDDKSNIDRNPDGIDILQPPSTEPIYTDYNATSSFYYNPPVSVQDNQNATKSSMPSAQEIEGTTPSPGWLALWCILGVVCPLIAILILGFGYQHAPRKELTGNLKWLAIGTAIGIGLSILALIGYWIAFTAYIDNYYLADLYEYYPDLSSYTLDA